MFSCQQRDAAFLRAPIKRCTSFFARNQADETTPGFERMNMYKHVGGEDKRNRCQMKNNGLMPEGTEC